MPSNETFGSPIPRFALLAALLAAVVFVSPSGGAVPKGAGAVDPSAGKPAPGGLVRGRLVDAESGRGLGGGVVFVFAEESEEKELERRAPGGGLRRPVAETQVASDGRFELRLPSRDGFYDLEARTPGRAQSLVASGLDGARVEQGLTASRLGAGGSLSGVVRDPEGKPLARARVLFVPADASGRGRFFPRGGASRPATLEVETDDDGTFRLEGVPVTGGTLAARAPGFVPVRRRGVRPATRFELSLDRGAVVEGRVLDAAGKGAVPGARAGWSDDPFGTLVAAAADGSFRLADLPLGRITLRAVSPRSVPAEWGGELPLAPEAAPPVIRLRPGGTLQIEARGRDGRPVPRARVEVRSPAIGAVRRGRTGARGELLLGGFASQALQVAAFGAGWLPATADGILLRGGETRRLPLLLEREATVAGQVVDEKGEPVAAAAVIAETDMVPGVRRFAGRMARVRDEEREAETDAAGRFRIDGLSARSFVLAAVAPGRARAELPIPRLAAGENRAGVRIVVDFGGLASGRVVDGEGNPLEGVRVGAFEFHEARAFLPPGAGEEEPLSEGTTGPDGEYLLAGLPAGGIAVDARRAGLARGSSSRVPVRPGESTRVPDIVLRPGAAILGKVVDRAGLPVPDASVMTFRPPFSLGGETTTDAEGAFRVDDLDAGADWTLFVRSPEKGGAEKAGIRPGGEPVEIRLNADGRIAGRVVVKGSGEPVPSFVARWSPAERPGGRRGFAAGLGGGEPRAFSSEAGTFELTGVEPGTVEVRVEAAGFRPSAPAPVVVPDDPAAPPAELLVELERGLLLGGRVLDASRAPAAGVPVSAGGGGGGGFARAFRNAGSGTVTDADGRFRLEGLEKGTVTIIAEPEGRPASSKTVELAGDREDVEILLGTGARVTGEVRRRDGSPAVGAEVVLTPGGSGSRGFFDARQETTDAAGGFVFTGVADGAWELRASVRTGATTAAVPLVVAGSDPPPVRLEFVPGARVDVRVSGLPPDLLRRLDVRGVAEGEIIPAQTAGEGDWFLEDVPVGELTVVAQTEPGFGGRRVSRSVELPEGGAGLAVELEFPAGARLSGRVLRRGEPMSGVVVSATAGDGNGVSGETSTSDTSGTYSLEGLADGPWSVLAFDLRTGLRLSEDVDIRGDTRRDLEFPAGTFAGRVVNSASGAPVPRARVSARPAEGEGGRFFGAEETGSDGRFAFEDVPDGELDLTAEAPGFSSGRRRLRVDDGAVAGGEFEIALAAEATLRVRVRLTTGGVASRARVLAVDPATGAAVPSDLVSEDGVFRVPGLAAGATTLVVESSGMAPTTLPGVPVPGEAEVLLGPGGYVDLVSGGDGERTCRLLRPDGGVEWMRSDGRGSLRPVQVVPPPGVRLGPIASGAWTLELNDPETGGRERRDVVVTAGGTTAVEWK